MNKTYPNSLPFTNDFQSFKLNTYSKSSSEKLMEGEITNHNMELIECGIINQKKKSKKSKKMGKSKH